MRKALAHRLIFIFAIIVAVVNITLGIVVGIKLTIFANVTLTYSLLMFRILLATSIINGVLILAIILYFIFRKD